MDDAVSFHSKQAHTWEAGYKSQTFNVRIEVLDSLLPANLNGQKWLDAGCGTGTIARWLADRGASVNAIDASADMISNAQPRERVEYGVADVCRTGLSADSFDGIVCSSVLEYLDDPNAAMQEFRRLIKPNGILCASVPNCSLASQWPIRAAYWLTRFLSAKRRMFSYLDHSKHSYSERSFSRLLTRYGFTPLTAKKFNSVSLAVPLIGKRVNAKNTLIMFEARA